MIDLADRIAQAHAHSRVGLGATVRHAAALTWRGLLKTRRHPMRLFDVVILPVVGTLMVGSVFGQAISGSDVVAYLPIAIPGLIVLTGTTAALGTGVQLSEDITTGVFDRFRSLPIARVAPLIGGLSADVLRYIVSTVMTILTGVAMGWRPASILGVIAAGILVVLCAFSVSWIFALVAVVVDQPAAVQGICAIAMMPFVFLSNTLVPDRQLPDWLQAFSAVNPVSLVTTASRQLCEGQASLQILYTVISAVAMVAIFLPLTVYFYVRRS